MQIFELHFNPRTKEDRIFDSFCYQPENIYEKRLGSLFMIGELGNALPQNSRLLDKLSQVIKGKYYAFPIQTVEKSLKEGLKKANEFLAEEASKENVSWLGNLNFAVLSLTLHQKNGGGELNFAKTGDLKILLLSSGQIIDIGKHLDFQEIEPYPLKIFSNIASGKLDINSRVMVLTQKLFSVFTEGRAEKSFSSESLLTKFAKESSLDEKKLKEILKNKKRELSEISGICLLIDLTEVLAKDYFPAALPAFFQKEQKSRVVTFQKELEKFSIRETFSPLIKGFLRKICLIFKKVLNIISSLITRQFQEVKRLIPKPKKIFQFPKIAPPKFRPGFLEIKPRLRIQNWPIVKKNLILVLFLVFFLLIGFFIFQKEEKEQLRKQEEILNEIQEKILQAENFLIFNNQEKANILLKEAWEEVSPLIKEEGLLKNEALNLKESIEERLKSLNKLEKITEPKLFFEFNQKDFIPQKIVISGKNLYFFNPYSQNIFKINEKGQSNFIQTNQKFNLATAFDDSILFFSKPDKIVILKNDQLSEPLFLKAPYPDFNFSLFSSFDKNLYFLDQEKGEIIKYPAPLEKGKDSPQLWLNLKNKKALKAKSMSLDGNIWILNENNTISLYYAGRHQKDLIPDFFPYPKKLSKILTFSNLPYLYFLEPVQNRIIILDKTGNIIKQFQSEKFDNLKDFAVSLDGKTIWLLTGLEVYQLSVIND